MSVSRRINLIKVLIVAGILLLILSVETCLHRRTQKTVSKPYDISLYTHRGEKIAPGYGPLKLATSPFTIYKNLPNQKTKNFAINSLGLRGGEIPDIPQKEMRIIVVGGSCAFGTGVANDAETFQVLLENLNSTYEVVNGGVAGFFSGQELTYVVTELSDLHPDVIIAFDGWNDLFFSWYNYLWFGRPREKDELGYNANVFIPHIEAKLVANYRSQVSLFNSFQRFFNAVVDQSALIATLRDKIARFKKKRSSGGLSKRKGALPGERRDDYFEAILKDYTNNLKKMHDFCSSQGITFLVVFQPELGLKSHINAEERTFLSDWSHVVPDYENEFPDLYKQFIERSKTILSAQEIMFIDINECPEFTNNTKTLFSDVVHPNKNGNEVIASILNEHLKKID